MKKKIMTRLVISMLAFTVVLSGCSIKDVSKKIGIGNNNIKISEKISLELSEKLANQSNIKKFDNLEDFEVFLEEATEQNGDYGYGVRNEIMMDSGATFSAPMAVKSLAIEESAGFGDGSEDFSKTNIQVEGVDEADIIKNDGKYIYAVVKNDLFILNAWPADEAEILSKIEFKSRPQNIYINGNNLVIFGSDDVFYQGDLYQGFRRRGSFTFLKVFDISDRKNPKQVRDLDLEGNYSNSRMIGDWVYFVTDNYNYFHIAGEPIVPRLIENGEVVANKCEGEITKCIIPNVYYFDIPYDTYNLTVVSAINVVDNKKEINQDVYTLAGGQNMYVSQENAYITYTRYISEYELEMEVMRELVFPKLSEANQTKIGEIEKVDGYILSDSEKKQKIARIVERYVMSLSDVEQENLQKEMETSMKKKYQDISKELEKTIIHKIAIKDGKLEYKNFGEVTGSVLNQFSMDENDGYFRIATTKNRAWSQYEEEGELDSYNNLYVLDSNMKTVGELENLAKGERIYSVRFMQGRAYMVTFKQIDPLFVIDLVDPKNPRVLGELKIPGFSSYLHPYDEKHLIGIGKDTYETEFGGVVTKGIKLSLFDVANVANPKEVDTYVMGDSGSDSIALQDHKAFLFSREKNLLSMPVTIREQIDDRTYGRITFTGAVVFNIDEDGFELKGKIDHSDGGNVGDSDYFWGYRTYDTNVLRTLYIGDKLYTFSNKYIKINNLTDLNLVSKLELKKDKAGAGDDFEVVN